jgi:hypothetical protein
VRGGGSYATSYALRAVSPMGTLGILDDPGFAFFRGLGTRWRAIRLPITTRAVPISSCVPWIVVLREVVVPVDGSATEMRALEMSAASLRPRPFWPMRWPMTASGIARVQSSRSAGLCGELSGPEVGPGR